MATRRLMTRGPQKKFHFCMAIREKMMLVPEARGFWALLLEIELVWDIKKALGPLPVPSVLPFLIQRLLLLCVPSVHCEGSEPEMIKLWGRREWRRTWSHKQDSKAYEREEIGGKDRNVTEHTCLSYVKQLKFMVTPLTPEECSQETGNDWRNLYGITTEGLFLRVLKFKCTVTLLLEEVINPRMPLAPCLIKSSLVLRDRVQARVNARSLLSHLVSLFRVLTKCPGPEVCKPV